MGGNSKRFHRIAAGAIMLSLNAPVAAEAGEAASDWVAGMNNRVRLIGGEVTGSGGRQMIAGIDIVMSPGFKTYWRNPGEAGGVPPEFDFSASQNVEKAVVLYPAPHRTKDKAGENIAYKDQVTFPVLLTPRDASKPVVLNLKATYGVCKDICIPAEAELSLSVPAGAQASPALAAALADVPAQAADPNAKPSEQAVDLDATKAPVLTAWRVETDGHKAKLVLEAKDPGEQGGDAFLFSADGLYMPMTTRITDAGPKAVYQAELTEGASLKELAGKRISVTLVGNKGQSETFISLPNNLSTP